MQWCLLWYHWNYLIPHWCQWHQMTKKSCCISFWLSGANKCNYTIANAISIKWCQCQYLMYDITKKVMLHLNSIILTKQMEWWYLWCHWQHMMLMPVPIVSTDWKINIVPLFNHLDLASATLGSMIKSGMLGLILVTSSYQTKWCHWQCHQCHVMHTYVHICQPMWIHTYVYA